MTELLVFTPQITSRVNYILKLFFDSLIKTPFSITSDDAAFKSYEGPKLNYSSTSFSTDDLQVIPFGLLTETGIKPQTIVISEWNKLKVFFSPTPLIESSNLPFDIFSASFYLVSRYEEYLTYKPDEHNRFRHIESLAFKNHFLNEPLVNLWAEELKKILISKFPGIVFSVNKYSFMPTVDIDVAYAHLGRSIAVTIGSYFKALSKLQFRTAIEKKLVLLRLMKDPFDTYNYQQAIFGKYKLRPVYFILAGERGKHDKNISPENFRFKKLIKRLDSFAGVGIHPSYQSENDVQIVSQEIANVEKNMTHKITSSRQHFLRLTLPDTYRCLACLGITDDYSMAYAGAPGFRASICTPFNFYDLKAESELPLKIHSSALMDGTLHEYLKLSIADSISAARELINKVRNVKGEFIFIWHNHSFSEQKDMKGLKTIFESIMEAGTQ